MELIMLIRLSHLLNRHSLTAWLTIQNEQFGRRLRCDNRISIELIMAHCTKYYHDYSQRQVVRQAGLRPLEYGRILLLCAWPKRDSMGK